MATELAKLIDTGTIRVLDLLVMVKNDDGSIEGIEVEDLEQVNELRVAETQLAEILAAEDLVNLAGAMESGTTAGVLVWENTWAAPFASAARRSGGQLVANGEFRLKPSWPRSRRMHRPKEVEMPLRPGRGVRRGVIGAPVAARRLSWGRPPSWPMACVYVRTGVTTRDDRRDRR